MNADRGMIVRRTDRHDIVLPVEIRIADEHADLVLFGPRAGDRDGWIDADLLDLGLGGAGVVSPVFIPRAARVVLRIHPHAAEAEDGGVLLEIDARVMRVTMTDRRPAYMLGVAFDRLTDEQEQALAAVVQRAETGEAG